MADKKPPQGWKQSQTADTYEANISQVSIPTGSASIVAVTNKTNGSYDVYTTDGINFIGGRNPLYSVSSSGATTVQNQALYDTLKTQGDIAKLDGSIKPSAYKINQTFGTDAEKKAVSESKLYKSTANAATNAENTVNFENSTAGTEDLSALKQTITDGDIRKEYGNYSYPKPFPEKQDRVKFTMFRYNPKSLDVKKIETGDVFGKREIKDPMGSVTLPITPQISDNNSVGWGNNDMNAFAAMAASASYNVITKGGEGADQTASAAAKFLQSSGGSDTLKKAAAAYLAGEAAGGNKEFLTRVTGALINPNTELLFNGPQLRTFGFSFTMSAREPDEAKEIKKIIRFFKQGMSIKRANTNLFLKTPNIFDVKYILGDTNKDHPWINKIKTCALTNCQVNYTPAGNYATFYDGAMTAYEITLSFTELDPVFEDDYKNDTGKLDDDSFIGY